MLPEVDVVGKNERIERANKHRSQLASMFDVRSRNARASTMHRCQSVMHSRDRILIRNEGNRAENHFVGQTFASQCLDVTRAHRPRCFREFSREIDQTSVRSLAWRDVFPMPMRRKIAEFFGRSASNQGPSRPTEGQFTFEVQTAPRSQLCLDKRGMNELRQCGPIDGTIPFVDRDSRQGFSRLVDVDARLRRFVIEFDASAIGNAGKIIKECGDQDRLFDSGVGNIFLA